LKAHSKTENAASGLKKAEKKHTKMTTRQHKGTFCWSTTSNQWKYE